MPPERCMIFGVGVDNVSMRQMLERAAATVQRGEQCCIFAVNSEKIMTAQRDTALRGCLNAAEYLVPDGIGAVFAARRRGIAIRERVAGSDLMPRLCELAATRGYRVYLFGARETINAAAEQRLLQDNPGLQIVGRHHGYVDPSKQDALIDDINESGAQLLFVALGSPKQEAWISRHRHRLRVNVIQGVGGTFDVLAGVVRRAPPLWIRLHLEWLYRLFAQPSRLKRQSPLLRFAYLVLTGRLSDQPLTLTDTRSEANA